MSKRPIENVPTNASLLDQQVDAAIHDRPIPGAMHIPGAMNVPDGAMHVAAEDADQQADGAKQAAEDNAQTDLNTDTSEGIEQGDGRRVSTAFAMKNFLPDADWINKMIVAQGKGTHVMVGRIIGAATKSVRKNTMYENKPLESIALEGKFEAEFALTGEIRSFAVVYLPKAFAMQVETALALSPGSAAQMDVDIGIEATGKTLPYEWTVTSYLEGRAERALKRLRQSRQIGKPAQGLLTGIRQPLEIAGRAAAAEYNIPF